MPIHQLHRCKTSKCFKLYCCNFLHYNSIKHTSDSRYVIFYVRSIFTMVGFFFFQFHKSVALNMSVLHAFIDSRSLVVMKTDDQLMEIA